MSTYSRLTQVYNSSKEIPIDNSSKLILMSDIHRGNNSWTDNFAHNQNIFITALNHYYNKDFTYIEVGDGDELWENRDFSEIRRTHSHVFNLLRKFYNDNRLYLIYGNHDIVKRSKRYVKRNLYHYYDYTTQRNECLFENIEYHEGLILRYLDNKRIFVVHGHQGDLLCDRFWWIGRFLIRYFWRPIELFLGIKDKTSPAKNYKKLISTERRIINWSRLNNQMIITGHTHRPRFPMIGEPLFFNTGSCIHPRCITGIEIENGEITLVKWSIKTNHSNFLYVAREIIAGPQKLQSYLNY